MDETSTLAESIVRRAGTVAVVGMSRDPAKAARKVPEFLSQNGFRIVPVNPSASTIAGLPCAPDIESIDGHVDVVLVFRPRSEAPAIVAAAAARKASGLGPRAVWLQEGISSEQARAMAAEAGLEYVEDRCMMKETKRLLEMGRIRHSRARKEPS